MLRCLSACFAGWIFLAAASLITPAAHAGGSACIPIDRPADLNQIRSNLDGDFCLTRDIDLRNIANFVPIGGGSDPFTGAFDGRGNVIRNLTINGGPIEVGLFGIVENGAVRNLGLVDVSISSPSSAYVGPLVGAMLTSVVENSFATGEVAGGSSGSNVGGLVGYMSGGSIRRSHSTASVFARNGSVGGLVGFGAEEYAIIGSYASGAVGGSRGSAVGGLSGVWLGTISRSAATGAVTVGRDGFAGGLVGMFYGGARNVLAEGRVRGGSRSLVGGLVGLLENGSVAAACSDGRVTGGESAQVGGLVAFKQGDISVESAYWSIPRSETEQSAAGTPLRRAQLNQLPPGLDSRLWVVRGDGRCPALQLPR